MAGGTPVQSYYGASGAPLSTVGDELYQLRRAEAGGALTAAGVPELLAALASLAEAADKLLRSYGELHDSEVLHETFGDPVEAAIANARRVLGEAETD